MLRFTRHGFREMLIGTIVLLIVAAGLGIAFELGFFFPSSTCT
jgi:hypothetical protein